MKRKVSSMQAFAMALLVGIFPLPSHASELGLPGSVVSTPRSPVSISACRASIKGAQLQPFVTYHNDSAKSIDEIAISVTELDSQDAEIEEKIYFNSDMKPGQTEDAEWINTDFPSDVAAVRCVVRAVKFTDGTRWGTFPRTVNDTTHVVRPWPCGTVAFDHAQPHYWLTRPSAGMAISPKGVTLGFDGDAPMLGAVRALRLVPEKGDIVTLAGYEKLKTLFAEDEPRGTLVVHHLQPNTRYFVVLDVWDLKRSREHCLKTLEQVVGGFRTSR